MNPIQTNKPVFFGNNGEVLKNGYIYIGQPNQDPVPTANRKTVTFQDTSGTQFTAQQPLRTGVDGRIVYQATGKPIVALVDGNYSMLIQDENQVIIKNGYTPFVANATTSAGSNTVIYRSTLTDLKAYNGTPGDYVENVGKITATDGDGARWLVVSSTGIPGDDVDLIDFDNGTQGVRVENQLYVNKNLSEIAAEGAADQEAASGNIDALYAPNALSEINTAGAAARESARDNIGLDQNAEVYAGPQVSNLDIAALGFTEGMYIVEFGGVGGGKFFTIYYDPSLTGDMRVAVEADAQTGLKRVTTANISDAGILQIQLHDFVAESTSTIPLNTIRRINV